MCRIPLCLKASAGKRNILCQLVFRTVCMLLSAWLHMASAQLYVNFQKGNRPLAQLVQQTPSDSPNPNWTYSFQFLASACVGDVIWEWCCVFAFGKIKRFNLICKCVYTNKAAVNTRVLHSFWLIHGFHSEWPSSERHENIDLVTMQCICGEKRKRGKGVRERILPLRGMREEDAVMEGKGCHEMKEWRDFNRKGNGQSCRQDFWV